MKVKHLLLFLAFVCPQSTSSFASDPAFGSVRALAELSVPGKADKTYFGSGIAMSEDGNTTVVGAPGESAVYVYIKPTDGWQTTQNYSAKLTNGHPGTPFGSAVAISGDTIVVVAYDYPHGVAFVFEKPKDGWQSTSGYKAILYSRVRGSFGPVGFDGDTIVIANQVEADVFVKPAGGWKSGSETAILNASDWQNGDDFMSAAIDSDTIIVGCYENNTQNHGPGAAYVYVKPSGGWVNSTETAELTPSDGIEWEDFGISVAFDGETAVVGAEEDNVGNGAVYVFTKPSAGWHSMSETAKLSASNGYLNSWFGSTVAIRGRVVAVGAEQQGQGAAYVYVEPTNGWQTTSNFNDQLNPPLDLHVHGPFGMGGTSLVTGSFGETIPSSPSVVVVYGID
jgi:hypothetical protein